MEICLLENKLFKYCKTIGVLIIPIVLWFIPIDKSKTAWTLCLFKNFTGENCYGCGITRATLSVIHMDFAQAFAFNKSIVFVFPILFYLWTRQAISEWKKTCP
jgi:hypothetical protein